ncbi:MAG: mevalonate kinase [Chloroflexi bacterium]|nr:mevalonate kinase [Chloroflexota bacterium]
MPAISASAPGKIILFGEHAVVYGQPAIAIPVTQVAARAVVMARPTAPGGEILIDAPDVQVLSLLQDLPTQHPLTCILRILQAHLGLAAFPAFHLRVTSTIPIAGGMGSGAAVAVAILRAVSAFLNRPLDDETVNQLAFESEKSFHGTPSGVDNTVITFAQPIYFRRGQPFEKLATAAPHTFVIADSGQPGSTADMVGAVRQRWQTDPRRMESHFEHIGQIVQQARQAMESPQAPRLGSLMDENHFHLQQIGVSTPFLDVLVQAALQAGALGAKLSGAGGGGNIIALVEASNAEQVAARLSTAGAARTIITTLKPHSR